MADLNLRGAARGLAGGAADFVLFNAETARAKAIERIRQKGATERNEATIAARSQEGMLNRESQRELQGLRGRQAITRQVVGDRAAMDRTQLQVEGRTRVAELQRQGQAVRDARSAAAATATEDRLRAVALGRIIASMYQGNFDERTGSWTVSDKKQPEANRVFTSANTIAKENPGLIPSDAIAIARMLEGTSTSGPASLTTRGQQLWRDKYSKRAGNQPTTATTTAPAKEQVGGVEAVLDIFGF